jgi:hypothetical protein
MKDSEGGPGMRLRVRPLWDPTGTVSVDVDDVRKEVRVTARDEVLRFVLRESRPERLGWIERRVHDGRVVWRRVSVGEVACHCLREWDAEQRVLAVSRRAAARALARGGRWAVPGRRLADQVRKARKRRRVSTLPFQVLLEYRVNGVNSAALTAAVAAQRAGYRLADGRSDTQRLRRRCGIARHRDGRYGRSTKQRTVRYETGVALCRAMAVDPGELGL